MSADIPKQDRSLIWKTKQTAIRMKENKIVTKKIIVIKSQTIKKEYTLGLKLINRSMENWVNPNSTSIF